MEIKNVGWPIPYGDTWPVPSKKIYQENNPYIFEYKDKPFILPYGYTYFLNESYKGRIVNTWV